MNTIPTRPPSCSKIAKNDKNMFVMLFLRVLFMSLFDFGSSTTPYLSRQALLICQKTGTMKRAFIKTMAISASEITLNVPMTYRLSPADSMNEPINP